MAVDLGSKEFWERLESDPKKLAAEVAFVDLTNLEEVLRKQPSLRAWVNAAHEVARIEEGRAEFALTKARARATLRAQEVHKVKTGDVLKSEAALDPEVISCTEALFVAQRKRGALRAMADALEDRLQMLIQLSANQRKEKNEY